MKIVTCLYSAANANESQVLKSFHNGIEETFGFLYGQVSPKILSKEHNLELELHYGVDIPKCDLAIQFGGVKDRENKHHVCRKNIRDNAKNIIYIETPLLGRTISSENKYPWYRIGLNGYLNGQDAFPPVTDDTHCKNVLSAIGFKEWQGWVNPLEKSIMILSQIPGDTSLRETDMAQWILYCIDQIRSITDRHIIVRLHPALSAKGRQEFLSNISSVLLKNYVNITWSSGHEETLSKALEKVGTCITYSSSSSIDAILNGVPVIAVDNACMAYPISSHFIEDILDPYLASTEDVNNWINHLAHSQWSEAEMRDGTVWKTLWPWIQEKCM